MAKSLKGHMITMKLKKIFINKGLLETQERYQLLFLFVTIIVLY